MRPAVPEKEMYILLSCSTCVHLHLLTVLSIFVFRAWSFLLESLSILMSTQLPCKVWVLDLNLNNHGRKGKSVFLVPESSVQGLNLRCKTPSFPLQEKLSHWLKGGLWWVLEHYIMIDQTCIKLAW